MKQTAVEWFYKTIINDPLGDWEYYFKQAKAMEKENAINFALQNVFGKTDVGVNLKNDYIKKYNETFKSE